MRKEDSNYFGTFQLHEHDVWGQIKLAGSKTQLTLRTEQRLIKERAPSTIHGRLHDFKLVSCVHCVGGEFPAQAWNSEGLTSMSWDIFPHQVLIGNAHFDPATNRVRKAWFSTGDIYQIFDDFDSFGIVTSPSTEQQAVIPETIGDRPIPIGPNPKLVYFAGRTTLLSAQLPFAKFEVLSSVGRNSSSRGASIEAHMWLQLEFEQPTDLELCLARVRAIGQFLSIVAGRSQGIERLQIEVDGGVDGAFPLDVHWILGPLQSDQEKDTPSWFDMPLDGVRRPEEFTNVVEKWFASDAHIAARARLYSCLQDGDSFTPDRLVAAANLFDLTSIGSPSEISPELEQAKQECLRVLRSAPPSGDRDSAIQGIQRIGSLTLLKRYFRERKFCMDTFSWLIWIKSCDKLFCLGIILFMGPEIQDLDLRLSNRIVFS